MTTKILNPQQWNAFINRPHLPHDSLERIMDIREEFLGIARDYQSHKELFDLFEEDNYFILRIDRQAEVAPSQDQTSSYLSGNMEDFQGDLCLLAKRNEESSLFYGDHYFGHRYSTIVYDQPPQRLSEILLRKEAGQEPPRTMPIDTCSIARDLAAAEKQALLLLLSKEYVELVSSAEVTGAGWDKLGEGLASMAGVVPPAGMYHSILQRGDLQLFYEQSIEKAKAWRQKVEHSPVALDRAAIDSINFRLASAKPWMKQGSDVLITKKFCYSPLILKEYLSLLHELGNLEHQYPEVKKV